MLLQANNLSVNYAGEWIFRNLNIRVTYESRIGIVGVNGAGKSTLLKCLTGEIEAQEGNIERADWMEIRHLTQNPQITHGNTLEQEVYSVFRNNQYFAKHEIDARIAQMLKGLGFKKSEWKQKVETFSGGWQMRINLAKVLLEEADLLLMDEPTNHLDMQTCDWLEKFLKDYPKAIVIVSHDRRFLDEVVTEIAEIERGQLKTYKGNYTRYVEQKLTQQEQQAAAAKRQEKELAKQQAFVDRFRATNTKSSQAKSREKQISKIERIQAPQAGLKRLNINLPLYQTPFREVMQIKKLSKSFGADKVLYKNINAEVEWVRDEADRIFILGDNGCGKTTLFKIIMGLEEPDSGEIIFGQKVTVAYYAQHQLQILDPEKTLIETLEEVMPPTKREEVRGILGRFLFSNEKVFEKVAVLSGGEKARLAIAKLMVGGANTLLLDEPTNHLDIPAQESIEEAISAYGGTIICISHDRHLISNHATQIWEFHNGSLIVHRGNYESYMDKRESLIAKLDPIIEEKLEEEQVEKKVNVAHEEHLARKQAEKDLKKLDKEIAKLHKDKDKLAQEIDSPEAQAEYKKLQELGDELKKIEAELEVKEAVWLELTSKVEA